MRPGQLLIITILIVMPVFSGHPALAQFQDLTRRVPDGANTILLMDVDGLRNSAVAAQEGWRNDRERAYEAGLILLPPEASRLVVAAKLDLRSLRTDWEMVLMSLRQDISVPQVAKRFQGTVDRLEGRDVAVLPGGFFAVRFGPHMAAVGEKSSRQEVARWIRRVDNNSLGGLSPYLEEGWRSAGRDAHIKLIMDLGDAFTADMIERRLNQSSALQGEDVDVPALATSLSSVRGLQLGVSLTNARRGALHVDFGEDITGLGDFAKPLLLETLADAGMAMDELDDWEVAVEDTQLRMEGSLEQSGVRRILSLFDAPPALWETAREASSASDMSEERLRLLSSQSYFNAVVSLLDDLRDRKQRRRTIGQVGVWFRSYARKIDRLPILNVHPDLVDWGAFVADSLREGQIVVQQSAARSRLRQAEVPEQFDVRTYSAPIGANWAGAFSWHGWSATPNLTRRGQLRSQIRSQEQLRASMSTSEVLRQLDMTASEIRRYMTQVFSAEF